MYVQVEAPDKPQWVGNAMLVPVKSEFGEAMVALLERREKRLPEPAGIYVTGKVEGSAHTVLLVVDELIVQRVGNDRVAISASSGTVTMIGLLLLAGKPVTMRELRNLHLAIRKRFRNYSVTAYNSIGVGVPGLRYKLNDEPVPDVAEVGVPVRALDRLCVLLGRPNLKGTELAWLVNNGFASALLSKMPPTHGTRCETVVRVVPVLGIQGGLLIPNETAKRHFADFDGDMYKLFIRINDVPQNVELERAVTVQELFLRGLGELDTLRRDVLYGSGQATSVKVSALTHRFRLDKIVVGEHGHMLYNGLLALIGADAKNLVAPVATGALAVVAWLSAVDKTGVSAIQFANLMLPLFEPLFDARNGLGTDVETVRKGMPFAHAVTKLLGISTPREAAEVIREIGEGADQFFGVKAGIGEEMRRAAAIIERAMEANAQVGGELSLSVQGVRTIQAMVGTTYDTILDGDEPMVAMFNGGEDATLKVDAFAPVPPPVAKLSLQYVPVGSKAQITLKNMGEDLKLLENVTLDGNELATILGFRFGRIYRPKYAPEDYRQLDNDKISAQPVDPKEMFPADIHSLRYNPQFRIADLPEGSREPKALVPVKPGATAKDLHAASQSMVVVIVDVRDNGDRNREARFRVLVSTGYYNDSGFVRNAYVEILSTEWLPVTKLAPDAKTGALSIVVGDGRGNYYCVPAIIEPHVSRDGQPHLVMGVTSAAVRVAEVLHDAVMEYLRDNVYPKDTKIDVTTPVITCSLLADFGNDARMGARKLNVAQMRAMARLRAFLERCQQLHPTPGEENKPIREWPTTRFAQHLVDISQALVGGRGALTSGSVQVRVKLPEPIKTKDGLKQDTCPVAVAVPDNLDWVAIGKTIERVFQLSSSVIVAPMKDGSAPFVVIDTAKRTHVEDVGATFAAATWYRLLRENLPDKEVGIVSEHGVAGRGLIPVNVAIIDLQHANLAVLDGKRDSTDTMFASGHFKPVVQVPHSVAADEKTLDADLRRRIGEFVAKVGVENVFLCTKNGGVLPYAQFKDVKLTQQVLDDLGIDYYVSDFRIFNEAEPQRRFVVRIAWRYAQSVQKVYFTDSLVKGAALHCDGVEFSVDVGGTSVPIDIVSSEDSLLGKKAAPAVVVGALRLLGQVCPEIGVTALEAEMNDEFYRLRETVNALGLTVDELEQLEHQLLAVQAQRVILLAREHGVDIVTAPLFVEIDGNRYELGRAVVARLHAMMVRDGSVGMSNADDSAHIPMLQHILHNCTVDALQATGNKPVTHGKFRVRGDEPEVVRGNTLISAFRELLPKVRDQEMSRRVSMHLQLWGYDYYDGGWFEDEGVWYG